MATVRIVELNSKSVLNREPKIWRGRTLETLIRRVWGKNSFFYQDNGLPRGYGQIFKNLPNRGNGFSATSMTGRIRVDGL